MGFYRDSNTLKRLKVAYSTTTIEAKLSATCNLRRTSPTAGTALSAGDRVMSIYVTDYWICWDAGALRV